MSPELAFLLSLTLRMAFAAAFVVIASMVTERSGPAIGALIATLPVSAGPSYIFLAIDHDDAFIAQSALFPAVFTSLVLILNPRIGGAATAAVLANGQWGLIGFGLAIVIMHLAAEPLGRAAALSLALAMCVAWNLGLWAYGHRARRF